MDSYSRHYVCGHAASLLRYLELQQFEVVQQHLSSGTRSRVGSDRLDNRLIYLVVRINKPLSCLYQHGPPPGQLTNYVPEIILHSKLRSCKLGHVQLHERGSNWAP
jgi:hypothetical protein